MGDLLGLAVYNPAILSDAAFLASFVARGDLVERLLGRLAEIDSSGLASHHLILGQRGMGKTSLLRRLAIGVRDAPALSAVLLPLSFREEQYNVHNLHVFWCNCLDALGDWFEATGQPEKAAAVDRDVAMLNSGKPDPAGHRKQRFPFLVPTLQRGNAVRALRVRSWHFTQSVRPVASARPPFPG